MVVLVGIDALDHVLLFKPKRNQLLKHHHVHRDLRQPNEDAARDSGQRHLQVPRVFPDVADAVSHFWLGL